MEYAILLQSKNSDMSATERLWDIAVIKKVEWVALPPGPHSHHVRRAMVGMSRQVRLVIHLGRMAN